MNGRKTETAEILFHNINKIAEFVYDEIILSLDIKICLKIGILR